MAVPVACQPNLLRAAGVGHSTSAYNRNPRRLDRRLTAEPGSEPGFARSRPRLLLQGNFGAGPEQPEELKVFRDFRPVCIKGELSWKCGVVQSERDYDAPGCGGFACHYHRRNHG